MARLRNYARRRKIELAFYTVFENSPGAGYHSHTGLALALPSRIDFRSWVRATLCGGVISVSLEDCYKLEVNRPVAGKRDITYSQWQWFRYCMKTLDPFINARERRAYGDKTLHQIAGLRWMQPGGPLEIDRVRISRSINREAQRNAHYLRPNNKVVFDDAEYQRGLMDQRFSETSRACSNLDVIS